MALHCQKKKKNRKQSQASDQQTKHELKGQMVEHKEKQNKHSKLLTRRIHWESRKPNLKIQAMKMQPVQLMEADEILQELRVRWMKSSKCQTSSQSC